MVLESDKETLQTLISDTLTLLCKNGLSFQKQISVEALVGITLDTNDIILVNVNRLIQNEAEKPTVNEISTSKTQKKRKPTPKRKLPVNKTSGNVPGLSDGEPPAKVVVMMPSYSSGDHLIAEDDTTEMLLTGTVTTDHDYIKPELDLDCSEIDSSADTSVSPQVSPHADDADRKEVSGPGTSSQTTTATPKQSNMANKKYTNEVMLAAYNRAKSGELSVRRAAKIYGIPEATLRARINCQVPLECRTGRPMKLSAAQEDALVRDCERMASFGYGYTRMQVIACAQEMSGIELGAKWFRCFLKRHPNLAAIMSPQPPETNHPESQIGNQPESLFS